MRFGKKKAGSLIGYGGFPSTHTTIVSSVVFLIGLEATDFSVFGLGLAVLLVSIIDAHGMRQKIGEHSKILNSLQKNKLLREQMGHSWWEVFGGLLVGAILANLIFLI